MKNNLSRAINNAITGASAGAVLSIGGIPIVIGTILGAIINVIVGNLK